MNNKALMGACAVVLVAILAGTYLWMDVDDDDTLTWHATHYECLLNDGTYYTFDADVDEEWFPLTISQIYGYMFIGNETGTPIVGIYDGSIVFEYQHEYEGNVYNIYAEGFEYGNFMNVIMVATDFDTEELFSTVFIQYTLDGKPAASMECNYFDFDMPFTPIDSMLYQDGTATSIPASSLTFKSQEGMFATFDLEVLGVTNEIVLVGAGYIVNNGMYCASGYSYVNGNYENITVNIADGTARFLFTGTSATGEAYFISSTYSVPYQEGEHLEVEGIEGTWITDLFAFYIDSSTEHLELIKVIEKVDDHYYTCTEVSADNGTFTWDIFVGGNYIYARVFQTIDGTTEEIGFLSGNSDGEFMYLFGIQYNPGYVDGYAACFYLNLDA